MDGGYRLAQCLTIETIREGFREHIGVIPVLRRCYSMPHSLAEARGSGHGYRIYDIYTFDCVSGR
jgi:hypothetical protein